MCKTYAGWSVRYLFTVYYCPTVHLKYKQIFNNLYSVMDGGVDAFLKLRVFIESICRVLYTLPKKLHRRYYTARILDCYCPGVAIAIGRVWLLLLAGCGFSRNCSVGDE